jgi:hypothetical protein
MTETEVKLGELQKSIAHLTHVSQDGWVLQWGETPQTAFEIVCRGANALQVEKLESLINDGHLQASALRK